MSSGIVESQGSESSGQQQGQGKVTRTKMVQRLLSASSSLPQFINDLLETQAVHVAGTEAAAFIIQRVEVEPPAEPAAEGAEAQPPKEPTFSLRPIAHIRPDQSTSETRAAAINAFQEILKPCIEQGKDGAIEIGAAEEGADAQFCLVTLLRTEGEVVAASAVITRCRSLDRAKQRLMSMQLVAGYFELFSLRRTSDQARVVAQSHQNVLQLTSSVATAQGFESASMNLCNELAARTGASRVSLGWLKGNKIKVKALSHTEKFDKKQELIVDLERAMEECLDQAAPVHFDPSGQTGSQNVTRQAQALSRQHGNSIVLSLPLRRREDIVGVVTLEFPPQHQISPQASGGLAIAVDLLAPQLYDRYQNDRWLITKTGISARETLKMLTGPQHMVPKVVCTLVVAAILMLCNLVPFVDLRTMYHVTAPFQFTTKQSRTITAPFEGEIAEVFVKPGENVEAGKILLQMKTYELDLELLKVESKAKEIWLEAMDLQRTGEKPGEEIIKRQEYETHKVEIERLRNEIAKASIKAPFAGTILRGDIEQMTDRKVKLGEPLMEMSDLENLLVEISVDERDIQDVVDGAKGTFATTSRPGDKYAFDVERIVPQGVAQEGKNVFKIYARVTDPKLEGKGRLPDWAPGLMGEAAIEVREASLAWQWTHRVSNWVRLKWWLWF